MDDFQESTDQQRYPELVAESLQKSELAPSVQYSHRGGAADGRPEQPGHSAQTNTKRTVKT
ncbi:MAG: hypothetical protein H0S85_10895 [Desulfovibrionaceae bacterium]|jgi:hypothetical protein|nr:hypothetical protein [Desulfovibrionaceae bacterium]